ncbi:hypothetical protein C8J25_10548 [Sphingomonas faeni]|uniref:Uncharacterized protein n=1 Tax=Sphingomonas faeni TaxID=185950 RepID=A0A2T5U492_9SPHN|nr:hypothetical protein [Sphingomonas faeni]PTW46270.1 hypothetical protein C8J25_10548 [Sphingomonas faeni]
MIPKLYHQMIDAIGDGTGLPDIILHIHAGMALLMIARLITRRSFGTFIPWWVVVAGEAFNEIMDRLNFGSWRWEDTSLDIVNTLLWPTVICLGVRLRPMIAQRVTVKTALVETVPDVVPIESVPVETRH